MENEEKQDAASENSIEKMGSVALDGAGESFYCLSIIGQIEGHYALDPNQKTTKYDHLLPLLTALEQSDKVDGVLILLNTLGGDVEAGLAIAEVIAGMEKPTASVVLGGGHSIGVPLAISAKRSFIVPSATMTIHPVRTTGVVLGVAQAFNYLEKMQDRIIRFIVDHSNVKEGDFRHMLSRTDVLVNDIGTILDGYEATACGLIDEIGSIKEALGALRQMRDERQKKK